MNEYEVDWKVPNLYFSRMFHSTIFDFKRFRLRINLKWNIFKCHEVCSVDNSRRFKVSLQLTYDQTVFLQCAEHLRNTLSVILVE